MNSLSSQSQKRSVRSLRGEEGSPGVGGDRSGQSPLGGRARPFLTQLCVLRRPSPACQAWAPAGWVLCQWKARGRGLLQSQFAPYLPNLSLPAPGLVCQGQNRESPEFHVPKEIPGPLSLLPHHRR